MGERIAIRADGNSKIGFGHLIRTQALARQLAKLGAEVVFLTKNPENIVGFQAETLNTQADYEQEDREVEQIVKHMGADMIIIDSYAYGQERLDKMAGLNLFSVYIDDMNLYEFNMDLLINGNLYASSLPYQGEAKFLLGSQYLLMREAFSVLPPRQLAPKVKDVLITFGAADMQNVTPSVLDMLTGYRLFSRLSWHVVVGPAYQNTIEIEAFAQEKQNVYIYRNPDMKSLIEKCDLCISAAGSTVYELAACSTPAMLIVIADNQLRLAAEAHAQGLAINLGWHNSISAVQIYTVLDELISDHNKRQNMAACGQSLIDGQGAARVAYHLLTLLSN